MTEIKKFNLDEELKKRDEIIKANPDVAELSTDIDNYEAVQKKIQEGEWLSEEELRDLHVAPEFISEYLANKKIIETESVKSPEDISAEYVAKQSALLEVQNKQVEEAREKAKVEKEAANKLDELGDLIEQLRAVEENSVGRLMRELKDKYEGRDYDPHTSLEEDEVEYIDLPAWIHKVNFDTEHSTLKKKFGNFKKDLKEQILGSDLPSEEIIRQTNIVIDEIKNEINRLNEESRVEQEAQERVKRLKTNESTIDKIRKFLSGK